MTGERAETAAAAAVGLYGHRLRVGFGSLGGWDPFGPERTITRSTGNVLYELDGRSALALYEEYLGEHAAGLPATGLLFPLSLRRGDEAGDPGVREVVGPSAALTGFYSYREISPFTPSARCELHNQTMTVTLLSES